jgi:hypothetical protein
MTGLAADDISPLLEFAFSGPPPTRAIHSRRLEWFKLLVEYYEHSESDSAR